MITDRTEADLIYANQHKDSSVTLKGKYNYTDLNRVESKTHELNVLLKQYGYMSEELNVKTNWAVTDFYDFNNNRYLNNIKQLINNFYLYLDSPNLPTEMRKLNYERANDIEKILVDIETLLNNMVSQFYYSNEIYSGEV